MLTKALLLRIRSPYFGGMWRSGMRETTLSTIPIAYADYQSFLIAMEFIYTDTISEGSLPLGCVTILVWCSYSLPTRDQKLRSSSIPE